MEESTFYNNSSERVFIPDNWRIRHDNDYIVAYECGYKPGKFKILSIPESYLLKFLNGHHNLISIKKTWITLFGESDGSKELFHNTIDDLYKLGMLSFGEGLISPSLKNNKRLRTNILSLKFRNDIRPNLPIMLTVSPTEKCNVTCNYCYLEKSNTHELTTQDWINLFSEIRQKEIFKVDIGGGVKDYHKSAV